MKIKDERETQKNKTKTKQNKKSKIKTENNKGAEALVKGWELNDFVMRLS